MQVMENFKFQIWLRYLAIILSLPWAASRLVEISGTVFTAGNTMEWVFVGFAYSEALIFPSVLLAVNWPTLSGLFLLFEVGLSMVSGHIAGYNHGLAQSGPTALVAVVILYTRNAEPSAAFREAMKMREARFVAIVAIPIASYLGIVMGECLGSFIWMMIPNYVFGQFTDELAFFAIMGVAIIYVLLMIEILIIRIWQGARKQYILKQSDTNAETR